MVDCKHGDQGIILEGVQLTDLENAAYLPDGKCVKGLLAGNDNWRSPEAHFKGKLSKPSDVFSFGLVVSVANSAAERWLILIVPLCCNRQSHLWA
jgi:hypothetical protein